MTTTTSSTTALVAFLTKPSHIVVAVIGIVSAGWYLKYQKAIKRRLKQVEEESWLFGMSMERSTSTDQDTDRRVFSNLQLLELRTEFVNQYKQDCSMLSLGEYLRSLQPKAIMEHHQLDLPKLIQRELEAGMASALLKALGPNLGRALLPALGTVQGAARTIATGIAARFLMRGSDEKDKGGLPLTLMTLLAASDTHYKVNPDVVKEDDDDDSSKLSAVDKWMLGEIGVSPSFDDVHSPFVMDCDFPATIARMERQLRTQAGGGQSTRELDQVRHELEQHDMPKRDSTVQRLSDTIYNPNSRKMADPVPINPRLFPGLHLGWGDAKCTHTNRQVLQNRLLSVLLNKLGANYYKLANGDSNLFQVQLSQDEPIITSPWELVQGLVDNLGHAVEVVPASYITTFGVALCVQNDDGSSWSNIPLACFLESGYEDASGNMAPAFMPHSGLDLEISGPLFEGTCSIQHYISIDGYCGWQSNHNGNVPWMKPVECGTRLSQNEAVRATRLAGLYAHVLNGIGTELGLPFGGYGLTAVCNDSAAVLQECLYGTSTIYPMTSIGRFMLSTMRYAQRLREELKPYLQKQESDDLYAIVQAMRKIPSDLNASPTNALTAAERMLCCLPKERPFVLMDDTKQVMDSIVSEIVAFREECK